MAPPSGENYFRLKLTTLKALNDLKMMIDRQRSSTKYKEEIYVALSIDDVENATRRHLAAKPLPVYFRAKSSKTSET
jgi:hypothetical protein